MIEKIKLAKQNIGRLSNDSLDIHSVDIIHPPQPIEIKSLINQELSQQQKRKIIELEQEIENLRKQQQILHLQSLSPSSVEQTQNPMLNIYQQEPIFSAM